MARQSLQTRRRSRLGNIGLVLLTLTGASGAFLFGLSYFVERDPGFDVTLPRAVVRRTDLSASLVAGGEVESKNKTVIECELEALYYRNEGQYKTSGGGSSIIKLIPEGTMVKKGDLLCELDSATYREFVRAQTIEVEETKAEVEEARLDLEAAEIRLKEYRDGILQQLKEQKQSQIFMAEAENRRQTDRVEWTERMVDLNYLPLSRLTLERQLKQKTQIELERSKLSLDTLVNFGAPKMLTAFEAQVLAHRSVLSYCEVRLSLHEKQLEKFKEQVELCTIRAPHDGFLIYANEDDDDTRIEEGVRVRQNQDLFILPDLSQMQVETILHETVVDRVKPGMPASVQVEALRDLRIEGHVVSVDPLPRPIRSWWNAVDVKNFVAKIELHSSPAGLMTGMTAQVDIQTAVRSGVLAIPHSAVTKEGERSVCYVAAADGLEKREVQLGTATTGMVEVLDGLGEGEQVIIDPSLLDAEDIAGLPDSSLTGSGFGSENEGMIQAGL